MSIGGMVDKLFEMAEIVNYGDTLEVVVSKLNSAGSVFYRIISFDSRSELYMVDTNNPNVGSGELKFLDRLVRSRRFVVFKPYDVKYKTFTSDDIDKSLKVFLKNTNIGNGLSNESVSDGSKPDISKELGLLIKNLEKGTEVIVEDNGKEYIVDSREILGITIKKIKGWC